MGIVDNVHATIGFEGRTVTFTVPKEKPILRALIDANHDAPYSCEAGICATCRTKLTKGRVHMPSAPALEKKESEQGYILTCQTHPTTDKVELSYES